MNGLSRFWLLVAFTVLTLIWGTTWAAIRVGLRSLPPFTGLALRFTLAAAILLPVARIARLRLGQTRVERRLWLVVAALTFCTSYSVVYWSEQWVPSGLAAVIFATLPLFVGGLAHWTLPEERLSFLGLAGLLIGFVGIGIIYSGDFALLGGPQVASASAVLLISPLASSIGSIAVKRWGKHVHPISLTAVPMAVSAAVMSAVAWISESGRTLSFDAAAIGSLLYLAICGTALTFTLYYWLLSRLPVTTLALISYTVPVVAMIVGTVVLGEPFTARTLGGSGLVLFGVALAARAHPSPPQNRTTNS
jgi:drug/metabolite transporter (DMT)-like permease